MITDIVRPKTVPEAVRARSVPGSAFLGGGTWLNSGASAATRLVSLENLGLGGIEAGKGTCTIGAMATFQQIVDDTRVPAGLRDAARLLASRTLRNMCTLGGELGLRPHDSALIPVLVALGATIRRSGSRRPAQIAEWLAAPTDDLILSVTVPAARCEVAAVSRTSHSVRSVVVAVAVVAAAGGGARATIVPCDCRGTRGIFSVTLPAEPDGVESAVNAIFNPKPDMHASAEYKRYMAGVMAADLVARL
jgi:putative selenate reductase FAD-binding subunit